MTVTVTVAHVRTGKITPTFLNGTLKSAFNKSDESGKVRFTKLGLEGDQQGDPTYHGGPDRAIHHIPGSLYTSFITGIPGEHGLEFPESFHETWRAGGCGENICTDDPDFNESTVCIGDRFKLGTGIVEVAQPRFPCKKIDMRHKVKGIHEVMMRAGRTGWFYRVIEEGEIGAGDEIVLLSRPFPQWPVQRIMTLLHGKPPSGGRDEIEDMLKDLQGTLAERHFLDDVRIMLSQTATS